MKQPNYECFRQYLLEKQVEGPISIYFGPGIEVWDPDTSVEDLDYVVLPRFLDEIPSKDILLDNIVAAIMTKRLKYGGKLVLFRESEAINRAKRAFENCLELEFEERFNDLLVYKKAPYRGKD